MEFWWNGESGLNARRAQFGIAHNIAPHDKWTAVDIILNAIWALDYAGYLPPYFHLIGPVKPTGTRDSSNVSNIEPNLREWLDESERLGVPIVYMALGSVTWLVDDVGAFLQAFSSCSASPLSAESNHSTAQPKHFRVVWQSIKPLAADTRAAMPEWVREKKWVAQSALLAHPATSLFISHMGASSMQEGVAAGLPMLGVPFSADEPVNAVKMQTRGIALGVDHKTTTAEEICHKMRHLVFEAQVRADLDRNHTGALTVADRFPCCIACTVCWLLWWHLFWRRQAERHQKANSRNITR